MKKIIYILFAVVLAGTTACTKSDFADNYMDPSKVTSSSIDKQYSGFLQSNRDYLLPNYRYYFVVFRTTLTRYTQSVGWANTNSQYVPGDAGTTDYWNSYYGFLAQYRELQKIYNGLSASDKTDWKIFMTTATIHLYHQTERLIDLHGDIPFSEAGMLSINGGDYNSSYAKYDDAQTLYVKMLDDLKAFADELNTATIPNAILNRLKTQDFINKGDITKWKKYCNSLRLRMLTRVSGVAALSSRASSEITSILNNPTSYPIITSNTDNVQMNVYDINTAINSKGFQTGLEDWNGNIASKVMIDHMKTNADPRLRVMFEPGLSAGGVYNGLDQSLNETAQTALINGGTMAIYNRSTMSRNQYFPGLLINAAEVSFIKAEAYLNASNDALAKAAYEEGITNSINNYYLLRSISNNSVAGTPAPVTADRKSVV